MILELRKVTKSFTAKGENLDILQDINLQLHQGESIAILGKSGSGKSTLLSLLAGLDTPSSGEIVLSGKDISKMSEKELGAFRARKIAIVFQQFHLLPHLSALENVSLPLQFLYDFTPAQIKEEATEALRVVGLEHRLDHYPRELSGGEQQRVAIARAIVVKSDLLLADEPTGNLDHQTNSQVSEQFFDIVHKNRLSLILVTHDESISRRCDKRYRLTEGRLELIDE